MSTPAVLTYEKGTGGDKRGQARTDTKCNESTGKAVGVNKFPRRNFLRINVVQLRAAAAQGRRLPEAGASLP